MIKAAFTVAILLSASSLQAASLVVTLRDGGGAPLADAVVTVHPKDMARQAPPTNGRYEVVQQNIKFQPGVLIVPTGASVAFPNRDAVRHHVYSFSKPKKFELKLFGRETTRAVVFDKTGMVALGCNIHDRMRGFVHVVDTPHAGKSDAAGRVVLEGLPGGAATLTVWHADARAKGQTASFAIAMPAAGTVARAITVPVASR